MREKIHLYLFQICNKENANGYSYRNRQVLQQMKDDVKSIGYSGVFINPVNDSFNEINGKTFPAIWKKKDDSINKYRNNCYYKCNDGGLFDASVLHNHEVNKRSTERKETRYPFAESSKKNEYPTNDCGQ